MDQQRRLSPHMDRFGPELRGVDAELLKLYYHRQHERLDKLTEERASFTNLVVASTAVALAILFGGSGELATAAAAGGAVAVLSTNIVAIGFHLRAHRQADKMWTRVDLVLAALSQELSKFDSATLDMTDQRSLVRETTFFVGLHAVFAALSLLVPFI